MKLRYAIWGSILVALLATWLTLGGSSEVIQLVAIEPVTLAASDSVVGNRGGPLPIGVLAQGERAYVTGCDPRKSDIDVLVSWQGANAVAWKGKYRLERRKASRTDAHAITSCMGLLRGLM